MADGACRPITTIEDIKHRKKRECEECVKIGSDWVQLRTCHECGVLC